MSLTKQQDEDAIRHKSLNEIWKSEVEKYFFCHTIVENYAVAQVQKDNQEY